MFKKKIEIKYPNHIAFIMDGNRRWATARGLNRMIGHKFGCVALKNIVKELVKMPQIKYASFFAFSTENWNRAKEEVDYIFDLVYNFLKECEKDFQEDNVKLVVLGDLSKFDGKIKNLLENAMKKTEKNTGLVINMALNYGGRADIVHACNKLIESGAKNITEEDIKKNLYGAESGDIDLLVRTSGEMRISNFMLFQLAYAELFFTKKYWPDFDKKELEKALVAFSTRNRRFGGK